MIPEAFLLGTWVYNAKKASFGFRKEKGDITAIITNGSKELRSSRQCPNP